MAQSFEAIAYSGWQPLEEEKQDRQMFVVPITTSLLLARIYACCSLSVNSIAEIPSILQQQAGKDDSKPAVLTTFLICCAAICQLEYHDTGIELRDRLALATNKLQGWFKPRQMHYNKSAKIGNVDEVFAMASICRDFLVKQTGERSGSQH